MEKTLKKILSLALTGAIISSMGVTAFASEVGSKAYFENDNGSIEVLPVDYSIEALPSIYTRNGIERQYVVEVSATFSDKMDEETGEECGVTGVVQIYWTDHFGTENELNSILGNWKENTGTVTGGRRVVGYSGNATFTDSYYPKTNSFGYYNLGIKALTLRGKSSADVKTSSGTTGRLTIEAVSGF